MAPWGRCIRKSGGARTFRRWSGCLPMVGGMTQTDLETFRPLVSSAFVAFGLDYRYGVEIAQAANRVMQKRSEMENARVHRHESAD